MRIPKNKNKCYSKYVPTEAVKIVGNNKISRKYTNKEIDKKYYTEFSLKSVGEGLKKIQKRD